ncbi:MAG: hypothetical protein BZ136_08900 [Methanosphaera sp. rholeuAM74]|nr:MAG: hypothetical protein BZ136_08900 [Methanosphaera sp. rholeuAM74]
MTLESNVTNGSSTLTLDTSSMTNGRYKIEAQSGLNDKYNISNSAKSRLTLDSLHSYGMGTNQSFTQNMWNGGYLNSNGFIEASYMTGGAIFQHELSGDFTIYVFMNTNCLINNGAFGFTTSKNSITADFSTSYDSTLFPNPTNNQNSADNYEKIMIKRTGTTYTIKHNGVEYKTSTGSDSNVYFYMEKGGSCSLYLAKIAIPEPFNNGGMGGNSP